MQVDIGNNTSVGNSLIPVLVLSFIIYVVAKISGSHYNGAVTLALMTSRQIGNKKDAYIYFHNVRVL